MVLVPSQSHGLRGSRGLLHGNLGVNGMPEHRRSRFQFNVDDSVARGEQDPEEAQVAARQRVECLESVLTALGESESAEAWNLNTVLKEARRGAQGRPQVVQVTESQGFIQRSQNRLRQMEEERVAEQQAMDVALARLSRLREEMAKNPDCDSAPCDSGRRSICRDSAVESEIGRSGVGTRRFGEEAVRSLSVPASDIPPANQSMNVVVLRQGLDRRSALLQTMIDQGSPLAVSNNRFSPLEP